MENKQIGIYREYKFIPVYDRMIMKDNERYLGIICRYVKLIKFDKIRVEVHEDINESARLRKSQRVLRFYGRS